MSGPNPRADLAWGVVGVASVIASSIELGQTVALVAFLAFTISCWSVAYRYYGDAREARLDAAAERTAAIAAKPRLAREAIARRGTS